MFYSKARKKRVHSKKLLSSWRFVQLRVALHSGGQLCSHENKLAEQVPENTLEIVERNSQRRDHLIVALVIALLRVFSDRHEPLASKGK